MALTFFVIVIFIIQTGNKNKTWPHALPENTLLWVSAVVGIGMGLLCLCFLMPFLRKRVIAWEAEACGMHHHQAPAWLPAACSAGQPLCGQGWGKSGRLCTFDGHTGQTPPTACQETAAAHSTFAAGSVPDDGSGLAQAPAVHALRPLQAQSTASSCPGSNPIPG